MKLIDYYNQEVAGKSLKEARAIRARWHHAAKRQCHFRWITSDPLPPPSVRRVHEDVNDENSPAYPVTTVVVDSFYACFTDAELEEVYRATKLRGSVSASTQ